jgi:HK97 family phage major capsid protein
MSAAAAVLLNDGDREQVKGILVEFKNQYAQVKEDIVKLGKADSATLEKLDKLDSAMIAMRDKYDEVAKKSVDLETKIHAAKSEREPPKAIGDIFVADPGFMSHAKSDNRQTYALTIKHGLYSKKDMTGLSLLIPDAQTAIVGGPRLPFGVRQLVPQGTTTAGAITYLHETAFTNNANIVAEGAAKPKSDKTLLAVTMPVVTIAHIFKVSKQSYDDLPGLASLINDNGIYGVQLKEDQQFLNGTGVGGQLTGFMTVATAAPAVADPLTVVDAVGAAIFDLANKGYMADGTVLNPADWAAIAMMKNIQGNYIFSNPMEYSGAGNLWGTRRVLSANMAAGNFLVGAFKGNSQILDRDEVNVQVAEQNVDDFEKNMLTVRIEERTVLLIYTAAAFEKGIVPVVLPLGGEARNKRP